MSQEFNGVDKTLNEGQMQLWPQWEDCNEMGTQEVKPILMQLLPLH